MKFVLCIAILLVAIPLKAINSYTHAATGIEVQFDYHDSIFPTSWLQGRIAGKAKSLDTSEVSRTIEMVDAALAKYPKEFLKEHLSKVYVLSKLEFFGVGYGGTYYKNAIFITNKGQDKGYTRKFMEKVFHAEFSSVLYHDFKKKFPAEDWSKANGKSFSYGSGGVEAIKRGTNSETPTKSINKQGFITEYGMSDMENDINSYAKHLFGDPERFWDLVELYPRIRKKAGILISFYGEMNPKFNEDYFLEF